MRHHLAWNGVRYSDLEMAQLLKDTNIYRLADKDPTVKLEIKINETLEKLQGIQRITKKERWKITADDYNIAEIYGLLKVHKEDIPLKPIISMPAAPINNLTKELWRQLKPVTGQN